MTEFDLPNYLAVPLSVGFGFLLSLVSRKIIVSKTDKHLETNREHLLQQAFYDIVDAVRVLNRSIKIDLSYDDHRNYPFQMHEEDKLSLSSNYEQFIESKKKLESFNVNTLGDRFYDDMMAFFRYGEVCMMTGFCYKHIRRAAQKIYLIRPELNKFEESYMKLDMVYGDEVLAIEDVFT